MFMPLIKQYVKDEKKAALLNMEFKNDRFLCPLDVQDADRNKTRHATRNDCIRSVQQRPGRSVETDYRTTGNAQKIGANLTIFINGTNKQ